MSRDVVGQWGKEVRFIFFSGKGGVGKSTMSCATAVWLAENGCKTLLVTTDPAPNLADTFGQAIGPKVTPIEGCPNLSAIEIDPDVASEEYKERSVAPLKDLVDAETLRTIKEQLSSPCVEEVAAFDKFIEFMDDPEYDAVIFDTAPTGHTIRLLELPSGWSDTLENNVSTCIGPAASLQGMKAKYAKAVCYLQNSSKSSFVFVLKPENSSIIETKRSSAELSKLGIAISLLIVNGILPDEACTDDFFRRIKQTELRIVEKIDAEFPGLEKALYPLRDSEVSGLKLLREVGQYLYNGEQTTTASVVPTSSHPRKPAAAAGQESLCNLFKPVAGPKNVFFTGKGGVGKSTIACTTALFMAEKGYRTLIVTTDPAAHLHVIFDQQIEHEPVPINHVDNLFAARIDQKRALEEYKARIWEAVKHLGDEARSSIEEDLNSPCAEEMAAFEKFMSYFQPRGYDVIVFDTAPTGHTLRLLELPTDWKGFIDLGSLTKATSEETRKKYADVIECMRDPKRSSFIFVMYPEYTPMMEALRASEDLKKQVGIETAMVAVNYLIPSQVGDNPFFNNRREQQYRYVSEIEKRFGKPMLGIPLLSYEPTGVENLRSLGLSIFE